MSWADSHIAKLREGHTVQFRPHGGSMRGRINSGQLVTVEPITGEPEIDAAVLCRVRGNQYVHLVKAARGAGERRQYLIGNNRGGTNGWIGRQAIYGVVTRVED